MHSQFTSLHTHTVFCDGEDDIETMCSAAYAKGLAAIGFSSHAPLEKTGLKTWWNMKEARMGEYIAGINAARRRWEGKLAVYLGLEVDCIKGVRSAMDSDIRSLNLDYIIGSVHFLAPPYMAHGEPSLDGAFTVDGPETELEKGITEGYGACGETMMHAYWDAAAHMIAIGGIDIVGHLDLVKKNNTANRWFDTESDAYTRRTAEIVRAIAQSGLVVEVNTGGVTRGYFNETCPSPKMLRLLRQHDVPVIITADAHRADNLDSHYPFACQTLLDAGYTHHVTFEGRSNGKAVWKQNLLP